MNELLTWMPLLAMYISNEIYKRFKAAKQEEKIHDLWSFMQRGEPLLFEAVKSLERLTLSQQITAKILDKVVEKLEHKGRDN